MSLPEDWFDQLKAAYPKRDGGNGWPLARTKAQSALNAGAEFERMLLGVQNYAKYCQRKGWIGMDLIQQAKTFFGPGQWWEEYADMDVRAPAQVAADAKLATLQARANALGVQVAGMDSRAAEEAIVQAERAALNRKWEQAGMNQPKVWAVK